MKISYQLKIIVLFILAGALISSPWIIRYFENKSRQSIINGTAQAAAENTETSKLLSDPSVIKGMPAHISVPAVDVSVDIEPGYYDTVKKTWTLSNTKASFAMNTVQPNNLAGNSLIYGHDLNNVFANLLKAKEGDKAILTTTNGHTFTYELINIKVTSPSDVSLFNYQGSPIITLQTCSGFLSEKRHLLTFKLTEVK